MHCARSSSQGFSWFRSCWLVPCLDHAGFGLRVFVRCRIPYYDAQSHGVQSLVGGIQEAKEMG